MAKKEGRKAVRTIFICVVIAILVIGTFGLSAFAQTEPERAEAPSKQSDGGEVAAVDHGGKDEVVYANLTPGGAVDAIYAVNHFEVAKGSNVTDYGSYESVVNLTNTDPINLNGDTVSFQANTENFYYQGNMATTDLPWEFDLSYYLNGEEVQPMELAGREGKLEIQVSSRKNEAVDPTFYDNYMLQISVTLNTETCRNIDAPGGTMASAGKDTVIAYTVLPGNDADFTLKADVQDFEMTGISITGMPYSMSVEFPDTDDTLDDLEKLPEAISELNDGVNDLKNGTQDMESGAGELANGSAGIKKGLDLLSGNGGRLKSGSEAINSGLAQIAAALNGSGLNELDLSQMSQLPEGLTQLADGLRLLSGGLATLKENFTPAYQALDGAIQMIPQGTLTEAEIAALAVKQTDPADQAAIAHLAENYKAAQTVKGTYGQVKAAFDAVGAAIDKTMGGINQMVAELDGNIKAMEEALGGLGTVDQLGELVTGITALANQYAEFHTGLVGFADGVSALAANYNTFHTGIAAFTGGVSELNDGVGELYDGTDMLNEEIADMPNLIQEEIDKMKEDYMPADFEPVSFTSSKNTDTGFVQFVLQCGAIEKPDEPEAPPEEEVTETFWDRLKALFQKAE